MKLHITADKRQSMLDEVNLGRSLTILSRAHADWSQKTFGADVVRGPIGALQQLAKEAMEAAALPTDKTEYAACMLLVLDASRRAGIDPQQLVDAAQAKLEVCRLRTQPGNT